MTSRPKKVVGEKSEERAITSMPPAFAEPAPLGLIGLAVAALVLGLSDLGHSSVAHKSGMIPWTIFLGATAQLLAGLMDFRRNNVFGGTAFTTYALLWYSVSLTLVLAIYFDAKVDMAHYAHGLLGFLFFSVILTVASLMTNKTFIGILVWIDIAIYALVMHILHGTSQEAVGYALLVVSFLSFYGAAAILLNAMAGKQVLSMGKPLWKP
ncbi:MAG: acetate uptake transporter [Thermoplasmata archaeon]|nr:acetate uptake transporter [Thermoplasmata archaeon]